MRVLNSVASSRDSRERVMGITCQLIKIVLSGGRAWLVGVCLITHLIGTVQALYGQSTDVLPVPPSMKVDGVPEIRRADVEHLFFEPSEIKSNLIWDVDRINRTLLVTDEKTNIYLVKYPMAAPERLVDKKIPNTVRVSPNGTVFAFIDDGEDQDNYELYLWSKGGKVTKLSSFTGKDESVESIVWSKSGENLFYSQTDYDAKVSKICRHDLSSGQCILTGLKGIWGVLDAQRDKLLLKYWKASSQQSLHLYDINSRKITPIDEQANSQKGFFAQGKIFWIAEGSQRCNANPCVLSMDLKTGLTVQIALPSNLGSLQDVKPSPDGKSFLVQETQDGVSNLRIMRLRENRMVNRVGPFIRGSYVIWNIRWLSNKEVVYTTENIGKPASIESFDLSSGKTTAWTKELLPSQLENKAKPPEVIKWRSFDGKQISGYVVRPQSADKKSPVLIYVHGGPQIMDRPVFNSQDLRFIANLGVTIIHTNIRGSAGFGNEFMDADNGARREDAVKDIQALLGWIENQPDIDSRKIYIRGESYGGFIALATALREPERVKGVIAEFPLVSIRRYLAQSWIDEFAKNEYGDPKDEGLMSQLDKLSPLDNSEHWNGIPLFLTRGQKDSRVPEKDVLDLKSQLQAKGSEVWFIYDAEAGHGVGGRYVTAAMYEFLKKQIRRNQK